MVEWSRERERERERERDAARPSGREVERQRDRETERQRGEEADRRTTSAYTLVVRKINVFCVCVASEHGCVGHWSQKYAMY